MDVKLKTTPIKKTGSFKQKARPPSALRLAITLLIQQPALAQCIDQPLPPVELQGYELLREMMAFAKQHPELSTGGLLEYFREREEGKTLAKLAQIEHMIPEQGIQNEFQGAIERLRKLWNKQTIDQLIAKANQMTLSDEEKRELDELIRSK